MRDSSSGPKSLMVARTGCPFSPNTSHKVTGNARGVGQSISRERNISAILACMLPVCDTPVKSPLMSAIKTGTPRLEKPSAMVCNVTVLPVPVAPVIKPWRLALSPNMWHSVWLFLAISTAFLMVLVISVSKVQWCVNSVNGRNGCVAHLLIH